jgi:hypothetical protein
LATLLTALVAGGVNAPAQGRHPGGGRGPKEGNGRGIDEESPVAKFQRMSPAEREKALRKLPPERQEKLRQQLQRYDQLPPEQKERLQRLWQLPPDKQQKVRQSMRDFSEQPQDRRVAMRQQLQQMRGMSADERKAYFKSPEFKSDFSPPEQQMMKNMAEILPPE